MRVYTVETAVPYVNNYGDDVIQGLQGLLIHFCVIGLWGKPQNKEMCIKVLQCKETPRAKKSF